MECAGVMSVWKLSHNFQSAGSLGNRGLSHLYRLLSSEPREKNVDKSPKREKRKGEKKELLPITDSDELPVFLTVEVSCVSCDEKKI